MTTRPGSAPCASRTTTPSSMLNYHRCSCARVLRALPQNNPDQLPSFFSLMPRWAPSTASTWTRSAFAIGLFLARDATLRSTSTLAMALATSTRATSTRARSCHAGRPQRNQRRHRYRLDRRHRPAPSTSARSTTSTRSTFLGAIELCSRSTSLRLDATPRATSTRATNVLCGSIHCPRTRAEWRSVFFFSCARRLISRDPSSTAGLPR